MEGELSRVNWSWLGLCEALRTNYRTNPSWAC